VGNVWFHAVHAPMLPWSLAPMFFYSFGMALAFPTLTLLALDLFPEQRGLASSCQSFISTGGAALVAVFAPLVWATGFSLALSQLVAVTIALGSVVVFRQISRDAPAPVAVRAHGER
jgi:DHA1 family bicyclomycin/chloramphenicol resistance-like MFS transporter